MQLTRDFFDQDAKDLAIALLGKVIRVKYQTQWLSVKIIETEAYYIHEKASHSSLGYTEKRKAMFMPAGTIYMYYCRGADSLNISAKGEGNAVLVKSGIPYEEKNSDRMIHIMQTLNPMKNTNKTRSKNKLCSGQTLLCKSLNLKVSNWNQKQFDKKLFYIDDVGYRSQRIIETTRLGIPKGRDEHLLLRFIDEKYMRLSTNQGRGV